MIVGFTGTLSGMTNAQQSALLYLLNNLTIEEVHHGDCVGADAQFAALCFGLSPRPKIIAHPGVGSSYSTNNLRAHSPYSDEVKEEQPFFVRNKLIVSLCDLLVATPSKNTPRTGGTWHTIFNAHSNKKWYKIVFPDGTTKENLYE